MSNIYLESDIISKLFSLLFSNRKSKCSLFQVVFQVPYYKKAITCKSNFTFMSLRFFYRYADFLKLISRPFYSEYSKTGSASNLKCRWKNDVHSKEHANMSQWILKHLRESQNLHINVQKRKYKSCGAKCNSNSSGLLNYCKFLL